MRTSLRLIPGHDPESSSSEIRVFGVFRGDFTCLNVPALKDGIRRAVLGDLFKADRSPVPPRHLWLT